MVVVNFRELRSNQQLQTTAFDLTSKLRSVQNYILSGYKVTGSSAANAYELNFSANATSYTIRYAINSVTTTLETVPLPPYMKISQVTLNGTSTGSIAVQLYSPFGKIMNGATQNSSYTVVLQHSITGRTKTVYIDGVSGRISQ